MKHKHAHNYTKRKVGTTYYPRHWRRTVLGVFTGSVILSGLMWGYGSLTTLIAENQSYAMDKQAELLAPSVQNALKSFATPVYAASVSAEVKKPEIHPKNISLWIDEAVQEFLPTHYSEGLMIMHCLAHRENGHAGNLTARGDNGLAIGAFQFHESTWVAYRNLMIKEGVATEVGDPMDVREAVRTTAWAMSTGRALAWGPVLRSSKGSNFATCPVPSWQY